MASNGPTSTMSLEEQQVATTLLGCRRTNGTSFSITTIDNEKAQDTTHMPMDVETTTPAAHAKEQKPQQMPVVEEKADDETHKEQQDPYFNPMVSLVAGLVNASHMAGQDLSSAVSQRTEKVMDACENVLLEIKSISEAREASRNELRVMTKRRATGVCLCGAAAGMMPVQKEGESKVAQLDEVTEDQTDRVLVKLEASLERLRELTSTIQRVTTEKEAALLHKIQIPSEALLSISAPSVVAKEVTIDTKFNEAQRAKLNKWYESCPLPYSYEISTMRTILSKLAPEDCDILDYHITEASVREWFRRRRKQEELDHISSLVSAKKNKRVTYTELQELQKSASKQIQASIKARAEVAHSSMDSNVILRELERALKKADVFRNRAADDESRPKKRVRIASQGETSQEIQEGEVVAKIAERNELPVIVRQIEQAVNSDNVMKAIEPVLDLLKSLDISRQLVQEFDLVSKLKLAVEACEQDSELRRKGEDVLRIVDGTDKSRWTIVERPKIKKTPTFTKDQLEFLKAKYDEQARPSTSDLEQILRALNEAPLRNTKKKPITMAQLRRWYNKKRSQDRVLVPVKPQQVPEAKVSEVPDAPKSLPADPPVPETVPVVEAPAPIIAVKEPDASVEEPEEEDEGSNSDASSASSEFSSANRLQF